MKGHQYSATELEKCRRTAEKLVNPEVVNITKIISQSVSMRMTKAKKKTINRILRLRKKIGHPLFSAEISIFKRYING
jgi:hypothetical protein